MVFALCLLAYFCIIYLFVDSVNVFIDATKGTLI